MSDVTAVAVAPVRISPSRRIDLADHLIDLAGAAVLLGHPSTARLVQLRASQFDTARTDAVLLRAIERLTTFISECAARGHVLPAYHPWHIQGPREGTN
jgi:hypothetical protein